MKPTIEHDQQAEQFYFEHEGQRGELKYYKDGQNLDMTHTHVPEEMENRGYGTALVEAALRYAMENDFKVIPSCPFVAAYFKRHASVKSLLQNGV